jgi:hypothetical protein
MFSEAGLRMQEKEGKRYFDGSECVNWLMEELKLTRQNAAQIGDRLMTRGFIKSGSAEATCFIDGPVLFLPGHRAEDDRRRGPALQ